LLIIFLLIYISTRSVIRTLIVLLSVPFSLIGAFWLLFILGYNMSVAVWVGLIALAGLDAETGVVMLLYLDHAWEKFKAAGRMNSMHDLHDAVIEGAVGRVRPKIMTVCAILFGLLPIMWSPAMQAGADVMKRIATPMIGGVVTSAILELLIYPVIYVMWRRHELPEKTEEEAAPFLPPALVVSREVRHGHEHAGNADALRRHTRADKCARSVSRQNQDRYVGRVDRKNFFPRLTRPRTTEFFGDREMKMRLLKTKIASR